MINLSLQPQIGAIAGWKLELRAVPPGAIFVAPTGSPGPFAIGAADFSFASADYRGSVEATMVSGLAAGRYTVVVEGVSEQDFRKLTALAHGDDPLEARLFLYWVDAPRPTVGEVGLVAVLRVTALRRRAGGWRYQMIVEGREWVYDRLTLRCPPEVGGAGPLEAATNLALRMGVVVETPVPAGNSQERSELKADPNMRGFEEMARYEKAMLAEAVKQGKRRAGLGGMYLIRDGKLLVGPDRITEPTTRPKLVRDSGLLEIERTGALREDEKPVASDETAPVGDNGKPKHRDRFMVTLRGRPDLKPGGIVEFASPEQEGFGSQLGFALGPAPQASAGSLVTAYVEEVNHKLSREQGFLTVVRCVAAASGTTDLVERLWFGRLAADSPGGGSSETVVTRELERARDAGRVDRWPDVAQVRAQHLQGGGVATPPLTEKLRSGLAEPDGEQYAAARQPFGKATKPLAAAPYATPFAYGPWGLVLPRYPGMRVLVVNRRGDPDDPVDVGALWSRGKGPPAEMGDWWLCLPVDVDGGQGPRAAVGDDEAVAPPEDGRATNDLIDAQGNRVIEVGKLTIRIGRNRLQSPGERPEPSNDPVSIVHDNGAATITITQNGAITITSAKTLTLKGKDGITLESGADITIKAGGKVDVKKGT